MSDKFGQAVPCKPGLVYIAVQPEQSKGHSGVIAIASSRSVSNT
jgi:hypothetical protein